MQCVGGANCVSNIDKESSFSKHWHCMFLTYRRSVADDLRIYAGVNYFSAEGRLTKACCVADGVETTQVCMQ